MSEQEEPITAPDTAIMCKKFGLEPYVHMSDDEVGTFTASTAEDDNRLIETMSKKWNMLDDIDRAFLEQLKRIVGRPK